MWGEAASKIAALNAKSLAQTWLKRTKCMSPETRITPRWNYVQIESRQGRPKQIGLLQVRMAQQWLTSFPTAAPLILASSWSSDICNLEPIENASDMIVISSTSQLGRICLGGRSSRNLLQCPDRLVALLNSPFAAPCGSHDRA